MRAEHTTKRKQKTVMVVEDIEINRKVLCFILSEKYNVIEADNGLSA